MTNVSQARLFKFDTDHGIIKSYTIFCVSFSIQSLKKAESHQKVRNKLISCYAVVLLKKKTRASYINNRYTTTNFRQYLQNLR